MEVKDVKLEGERLDKLGLPILLINIGLLVLLIYLVVTSAYLNTAQAILAKAVDNLESCPGFRMNIQENSRDYRLEFQGEVSGNNIYGFLSNYDLEIYRVEDQIYIKDDLTQRWARAEDLSLDGLYNFLQTPEELLSIFADEFSNARFGPDETINGRIYKTLYFSGEKSDLIKIFPELDRGNEYIFYMWVDREELIINRMALLISVDIPGCEEKKITRWFLIEPDKDLSLPELPAEIQNRL